MSKRPKKEKEKTKEKTKRASGVGERKGPKRRGKSSIKLNL